MNKPYRIVVEIGKEVQYYRIQADSMKEALENFKNKVSIYVPMDDPNANYEIVYNINKRLKKYILVAASDQRNAISRLKEILGVQVYRQTAIHSIKEIQSSINL